MTNHDTLGRIVNSRQWEVLCENMRREARQNAVDAVAPEEHQLASITIAVTETFIRLASRMRRNEDRPEQVARVMP